MILKRLGKAFKRQDWFVVLVEIFIVVIGIYIGLQVDDWSRERENKAISQTYYARLIDDLMNEKESLDLRIRYYEVAKEHGFSALSVLNSNDSPKEVQFLVDLYQASQIWPYTPQRSTYDEMLSGGIAQVIPDPLLRAQLANYFVNIEITRLSVGDQMIYRERIRHFLPYSIQQAIRQTCGDRFKFLETFLLRVDLVENCTLEFSEEEIREGITAIAGYEDISQDLTRLLSDLDTKLFVLREEIEPTERLINLLRGKVE